MRLTLRLDVGARCNGDHTACIFDTRIYGIVYVLKASPPISYSKFWGLSPKRGSYRGILENQSVHLPFLKDHLILGLAVQASIVQFGCIFFSGSFQRIKGKLDNDSDSIGISS